MLLFSAGQMRVKTVSSASTAVTAKATIVGKPKTKATSVLTVSMVAVSQYFGRATSVLTAFFAAPGIGYGSGSSPTNVFRRLVTTFLSSLPVYLAVGTGSTTPTNADTSLATEVTTGALGGSGAYVRTGPFNGQIKSTSFTGDTCLWLASWTNPSGSANSISVNEAAMCVLSSGGSIYYREVFSPVSVAPGFAISISASIVAA